MNLYLEWHILTPQLDDPGGKGRSFRVGILTMMFICILLDLVVRAWGNVRKARTAEVLWDYSDGFSPLPLCVKTSSPTGPCPYRDCFLSHFLLPCFVLFSHICFKVPELKVEKSQGWPCPQWVFSCICSSHNPLAYRHLVEQGGEFSSRERKFLAHELTNTEPTSHCNLWVFFFLILFKIRIVY